MLIALFLNESKPHSLTIAKEICDFLKQKKVQVVTSEAQAKNLNVLPLTEIDPKSIDFRICLGGDGTILRLVHRYPEIEAPLLGINLGSLGFMADIPINDIYPSLEDLLKGHYYVENRLVMEGHTSKGDHCVAVNDLVIHRAQNPCLVELAIHIDGTYLNTFLADGIIFSTPNGSTAYSLAAGGPIVSPELEAFVITPICPHTISNRPIVLMPKQEIRVEYMSSLQPVEISYDGISSLTLSRGENFIIKPSARKFNLVTLTRHNYYSTLREKLGWQGKLKT
ncbi:MAG: NAD(+)/NADH kinase [Parachlamydiaceae bacterium]|nr:NAD(+)/NADH kinase [Parachlamydiaceae bacterium]